ncbi:hypothetical protein [Halorussus litoreus]|nr:hypothetical protein [Halorussus litoreus]
MTRRNDEPAGERIDSLSRWRVLEGTAAKNADDAASSLNPFGSVLSD